MYPDYNKGHQPGWARWGEPKNAYHYARWIELGIGNAPHRPVMKRGFDRGKRVVAAWMMKQTWAYIEQFARAGRAGRMRRQARAARLGPNWKWK